MRKKTGFTLIELLVVISIIGILAAALVTQVTKMKEVARSMKCKANLKNLAQAALNYGVDYSFMPYAGSYEVVNTVRAGAGFSTRTYLCRGWVDWTTSAGGSETWPKDYSTGPSFSGAGQMVTAISGKAGFMSVTNGALWSYMGREISAYGCEAHKSLLKTEKKATEEVFRSYFMNGYFGYNKDFYPTARREVYLNGLAARGSAANLLLFAELAVQQSEARNRSDADGVIETILDGYNDGVDTRSSPVKEVLGFNHRVGKQYVAHVAYADGHVDVFHTSSTGLTPDQLKALTYFLCNGYDLPKKPSDWRIP